jgi:hypothetical protein
MRSSQRITMNNEISPPIYVQKAEKKPPFQALYIEAYNEYFSEITFEEQKVSLLECLNSLLEQNPDLVCHISLPQDEEENCLALTATYLGANSAIEKKLRQQISDEYWLPDFLEECKNNAIKTVHIGGVYGRACVWDAARSMANNIYAKQLGDKHPNMRFADTAEVYRFENAVISEDVTEGHTDSDLKFSQLVLFPKTKLFTIDLGSNTDIVTMAEEQYPGEVGESYELYAEEYLESHYALHTRVQASINAKGIMDRNRMYSHPAPANEKVMPEPDPAPSPLKKQRIRY